MPSLLTVGRVAARAGISADTIRYYERIGVLQKPTRTAAGYRHYSDAVFNRIALVRNAQRFGFSLREIAGFLAVRERGGKPCHEVRAAGARLLDAVDRQIAELTATRRRMCETLGVWDRRLAATAPDVPARLLEVLPASATQARSPRAARLKRRRQ
jgi:DNA-binding transcriptional MerR regulator